MPELNYAQLIQQQKSYFLTGETKTIAFRRKQLKKLRDAVLRNEELIYEALYKDLHKSKFEAYATEIGFVLEELTYHIKHVKKWAKPKRVRTPLTSFPASSYQTCDPKGNVLIMAPWNYPFQLTLVPLIGAVSAGNTAVIKPSEISIHTAQVIEKIISETFDEKHLQVIIGGAKEAQELLQQDFDHIFFTGSGRIGRIVLESAASRLIPVTLELGGKSPCIVDEDVHVKLTARRIIWGKLINAGQTCIAPNCLIVHEKIKDKLLPELVNAIKKFYGENIQTNKEYPRIINRANMERLIGMMEGSKVY
ncbi:MAG: aldehyde dehydrogenase family protein, partial [Bacteroidetes bacterium]